MPVLSTFIDLVRPSGISCDDGGDKTWISMKNIPPRRKRQKTPPNCRLGSCDQFFVANTGRKLHQKAIFQAGIHGVLRINEPWRTPPKDDKLYLSPQKLRVEKHCYIHFSSFMKWFLFREPIRFFGVSIFFSKRQVCFRETVPPGPGSTPKSHKKSWSGSGQTKVQLEWIQLRAKEPRHSWGTKSDRRMRPIFTDVSSDFRRTSSERARVSDMSRFLVPVPSSSSSEVTVGTTDQTSQQLKPLKAWCFEVETFGFGEGFLAGATMCYVIVLGWCFHVLSAASAYQYHPP